MFAKFHTARLQVEAWSDRLNDKAGRQRLADELVTVLTPDVLRHLPAPLQISDTPQAIDHWMTARAAESDVFTVRNLATSDLLGLVILAEFPEPEAITTVHLGYLFAAHAWGKGYATELLNGLVQTYLDQGTPVQLLGGVERDNVASARVLQKAGFEKVAALPEGTTDMFRRVF